MTSPVFNPIEFITEASMKNYAQLTWKVDEEGKTSAIALEESSVGVRIKSKSQPSFSAHSALDVLIFYFNKMNFSFLILISFLSF